MKLLENQSDYLKQRGTTSHMKKQQSTETMATPGNTQRVVVRNDLISFSKLLKNLEKDPENDFTLLLSSFRGLIEAYGPEIGYGLDFILYEDFQKFVEEDKSQTTTPEKKKASKQTSAKKKFFDALYGLNIAKTETADLLLEIKKSLRYELVTDIHMDFNEQSKNITNTQNIEDLINLFQSVEIIAKKSNGVMIKSSVLLGEITKKMRLTMTWADITQALGWSETKLRNCIALADLCSQYPKFLYATVNVTVLLQTQKKLTKYLDNASYDERTFWQDNNKQQEEEKKSTVILKRHPQYKQKLYHESSRLLFDDWDREVFGMIGDDGRTIIRLHDFTPDMIDQVKK